MTLVALLIRSWGEGMGIAEGAPLIPSIFLVGDRKQSIYGFRDADVAVMDEAGAFVDGLRADHDSRRAISRSFRAVPQLLAFANDLFADIEKNGERQDAFRFGEEDKFPVELPVTPADALGIVAAPSVADHADAVAAEIRRPSDTGALVRDPATREPRPIARATSAPVSNQDSHQDFEKALERRHVPSYVYKGLGFFEAGRDQGRMALFAISPCPSRICERRRSCARGSYASRIRRCRHSPRISLPRCRARTSTSHRSIERIASSSSACGKASGVGSASSIDCHPPKCSSWCSTKPHTCSRRGALGRGKREKT